MVRIRDVETPLARIEMPRTDIGSFVDRWEEHAAASQSRIEISPVAPHRAPPAHQVGRPSRLESSLHDIVLLTITGGTASVAVRSLALVLSEHIRAQRSHVRVLRKDGSEIELDGTLSVDELERLLGNGPANHFPPER